MSNLTLPDPANVGDPNHDTDHNLIVTAISTLNSEKLDAEHLQGKGDMVAASAASAQARVAGPTVNNQVLLADSAVTPGVRWAPQPLRFMYYVASSTTWTNQPVADTLFLGATSLQQYVDLTGYSRARFYIYQTTTGNTTAKLMLRYSSVWSSSASSYVSIAATGECEVMINSASAFRDSNWVDLTALAKAPVWIAIVGTGGNASADPAFASPLIVQFA